MAYTTETLVEGYLRTTFDGTTTPSSTDIASWISWAEAEIDAKAQTTFGTAAVADEVYDYNEHTTWMTPEALYFEEQVTREDSFRFLLHDTLQLKNKPIVSITSVYKNTAGINSAESWQLLTSGAGGDYLSDLTNGRLIFIQNTPRYGLRSAKVSYVYGYSSVPAVVQRLATLLVAREVISSAINLTVNQEGGSVQVGPIRVTDPSDFSLGFMRSMNDEIESLWAKVGFLKTVLV